MTDIYKESVYLTYDEIENVKVALEIALDESYDQVYQPLIDKFRWLLDDPDWIRSDKDNWKRR